MNEELLKIIEAMEAANEPAESIAAVVQQYMAEQGTDTADTPAADVMSVSQRDVDAGIKPESYVNSTYWNTLSDEVDRSQYYDSEGNFIANDSLLSDPHYNQALQEEQTRETIVRDSSVTGLTETEKRYDITEEDEKIIESEALNVYNNYASNSEELANIPEDNVGSGDMFAGMMNDIVSGRLNGVLPRKFRPGGNEYGKFSANPRAVYEAWLRENTKDSESVLMQNINRFGKYQDLVLKFANEGYQTDTQIREQSEANEIKYFNTRLRLALNKYLEEAYGSADSAEAEEFLKNAGNITLKDIKDDVYGTRGKGKRKLKDIYDALEGTDELRSEILAQENRGIRSNLIKNRASEIAKSTVEGGTYEGSALAGTGAINSIFGKTEQQLAIIDASEEDFAQIQDDAKQKAIEGDLVHQQLNVVNDRLSSLASEIKDFGDPKEYIKSIKDKYDLNTEQGINDANKEIQDFIGKYTNLIDEYNVALDSSKSLHDSVIKVGAELEQLSIREQDLNAFTNQISKNHRVATQMALSFHNGIVSLGEGGLELAYMVNPLGALSDELVDLYGEDSFVDAVIETARFATALPTGGISLYSGERRDKIRGSIDGYKNHVNSLVVEPPKFDDIDGFGSAVEWALITGASQAPQLALLAATGGTAGLIMMGGISAGNKFSEMDSARDLYRRTGGMYGQNHSFGEMYAASLASGTIEALSEKVTLNLLKGTGGISSKFLFGDIGKRAATTFLRKDVLKVGLRSTAAAGLDLFDEGASEALAQMGGNYIDRLAGDKEIGIFDGVDEAFVTGALIGGTLSAPTLFRNTYRAFQSVEASDVLDSNRARIQELNSIINDPNSTEETVRQAEENIQSLVAENAELIAFDLKRVDSLSKEQKAELLKIDESQRNLEVRLSEIAASEDLTKEQKEKIYAEMNIGYNKNLARKNQILKSIPTDEVLKNHENDIKRIEEESARLVAEGGPAINVTRSNGKNDADIASQFEEWKNSAKKRGNVKIAASEDGTRIYGAMVPILDNSGKVVSYEMFFNDKNIYEDGVTTTGTHELLHAAIFNTIRANPVLRNRFGDAINRILDGPGVKISKKAQEQLDLLNQYSKEQRGEELFAKVSELMVSGDITIDGGAVGKFKDLLRRTSMQNTDTDIVFDGDVDVRNFLKDYSRSRKKGIADKRITSLFTKGAKGRIVEQPKTREEARRVVEGRLEEALEESFMTTLSASIRSNPDLRQEFDQFTKNEDGTPKYKTQQEWESSQDYVDAYQKIVESNLLDGLIQTKMIERGVPPAALRDFTRKVKENIGLRFLPTVDKKTGRVKPDSGYRISNDSLFGWLTGVAGGAGQSVIYRAKGDVMNEYKESGNLETVSLDAPMGETTTFEATIEAETDALMQQLEEADLSRTRVEREARKPKKVVNELNIDSDGKAAINKAVADAAVDIAGLQYKDVKKLGNSVDAPLYKTLQIVSEKFGVNPKNVIKSANLNTKQRKAAQQFINDNVEFLLEMLPDGETRSGEATGVPRVLLNNFYEKGERLKYKDGATAAGKFTQQKRTDITPEQFKEAFGIRPDGTLDNNRKYDSAINALVNQATMLANNQALREHAMKEGTASEAVVAKLGEGKAEVMFSVKVRDNVKNTFDQLYPDLITAVAASNTGDIDSIRVAVESVYGNVLSTSEIKRLVNEIYDQADEYNTINQNLKGVGVDVPVSLEQFLQAKYESNNSEKGILKALEDKLPKDELGKTTRIGTHFLDLVRINKQRAVPGLFVAEARALLDKKGNRIYSDKQIAEMLIAHAMPMFAGSGRIADRRFIVEKREPDGERVVVKDPNWKPTKRNKKGQEVPQKNRKQAFQSVPDFIAVLNTLGLGKIEKVGKGYTLDGAPLDTTLIPETSEARLSRSKTEKAKADLFEKGKKQAKDARVVTKIILDSLYAKANDPSSSYDYADFAMTLTSLGSNMQAPMRRAALFEYFMEGVEDVVANRGDASIGSVTEFEHLKPQEEAIGEIIHSYLTTGELDMRIFEGGGPYRPYKTGVISKSMDNAVTDAGHKFISPRLGRGDSRQYSYEAIGDSRIRPLRSIDPAKKGTNKEFIGREWVQMNDAVSRGDGTVIKDMRVLQGIFGNISFSKRPAKNKGASVLDFDDTLATTNSSVLFTAPDGTKGKLNAEEYARDYVELLGQGYEFDFSEFNKVVDGAPGPLLDKAKKLAKKFGTDNMFILTARAPQAQEAIFEFMKSQSLEIPIDNIVGLGNSTGQAKANWIAENLIKEGYNDMYFADDALQNVEAVKAMFELFDVKSKVQQAKAEFSRRAPKKMDGIIDEGAADLDSDFNIILEQTKGVARFKQFSAGKARQRGKNKGRFKFFIPPSADDFAGLLYSFMGKGEIGNKHHAFFKKHLFDPFSKGVRLLNRVNQIAANDLKNLRKSFPDVRRSLKDKLPGLEYTTEDAIRVYNWNKQGFDVPGLSQTDLNAIVKAVEGNASLKAFADGVSRISVGKAIMPDDSWLGGTIASDINDSLENARSTYLQEWIDNKNAIFTEANMNKIEAVYGSNFREALEDVLFRMENGGNRSQGQGRLMNTFTNWIHGSIGTTMFFNARSAMLQMISNVNFINWSDNNMLKAAAAFANQKQYWSDVAMIFNSDFLKQRRGRIQTDVNAAELLAEIRDSKNPMKKATAYLLQLGFTPTQIADSFAIATGGATFYRNRVDSYIKEGMSKKDAETKAFEDMMEIAEETQQSTREDRISQQQASPLGKFILAFQNTPMQYNRLIKKAAQDLVNGRGDATANVSKIVYYGAIQNMIFYGLQQALFAAMFGDDEEDKIDDKQKERMINGMLDTVLRGSGIGGAVVSTTKNVILKFMEQEEKAKDDKFFTEPDHAYTVIEALNISPPIGIKARKLYSALQSWEFNREVIDYMDKTDIDNPVYDAVFSATEAVTNLPLSRLYSKYQNLKEAANSDHETWKRVAMLLGWSKWSFGIKNQDVMSAKNEIKEIKAEEREERQEQKKLERQIAKDEEERQVIEDNKLDQDEKREEGDAEVQCAAVSKSGKRCSNIALDGKSFCTVHDEVPQQENEVQCSHTKSNGERCKMKTKNKSGKCYYHD